MPGQINIGPFAGLWGKRSTLLSLPYHLPSPLLYCNSKIARMISPFIFNHKGQEMSAELIFNFDAISDMIGIEISNTSLDDILFYRTSDKQWVTREPQQFQYPDTYTRISHQLEQFFYQYHFMF